MDHPKLSFAAIGFSLDAQRQLSDCVNEMPTIGPRWSMVAQERADAWIVHPESLERDDDTGGVRVWNSMDRLASTTLHDKTVSRPIAVAVGEAVGSANEIPQTTINATSTQLNSLTVSDLRQTLQFFEAQLRLVRVQFAIGDLLHNARHSVAREQRVYHLMFRTQLLAIVDAINFKVAIGPKAVPVGIAEAVWQLRPAVAIEAPPDFVTVNMLECLWQFSQRSAKDHLPSRYRSKPVHFWRTPPAKFGYYQDEHIGLLSMLRSQPRTLGQLVLDTGWSLPLVSKILEGLYVTGAVSTQSTKPVAGPSPILSFFSRKTASDQTFPLDSDAAADSAVHSLPPTQPVKSVDWAMDTRPGDLSPLDDSK